MNFHTNISNKYFNKNYLSFEEMDYHVKLAKTGNIKSQNLIIESLYKLVFKKSHKIFNRYVKNIDFDDIFHDAIIGLINCLDNFNPNIGDSFVGFAHAYLKQRIVQEITKYFPLKISREHLRKNANIYRMKKDGYTLLEISKHLNMSIETAKKYEQMFRPEFVLNESNFSVSEENVSIFDFYQFKEDFSYEIIEKQSHKQLHQVISLLKDKEKEIIYMYYGFEPYPIQGYTIREMANKFDISHEGARKILLKALDKLKRYLKSIDIDKEIYYN